MTMIIVKKFSDKIDGCLKFNSVKKFSCINLKILLYVEKKEIAQKG